MPVQLMQYTDPVWYGFSHAMDHRPWIGVWSDERSKYTAIPYHIGQEYTDPGHDTPEWRLWHAQAHHDTVDPPADPIGPFSTPMGQILSMSGTAGNTPDAAAWFVFSNWQQHFLVSQNIAENQYVQYYPYW